jgi:hypothetical protein
MARIWFVKGISHIKTRCFESHFVVFIDWPNHFEELDMSKNTHLSLKILCLAIGH